jgi:hypothetical protein
MVGSIGCNTLKSGMLHILIDRTRPMQIATGMTITGKRNPVIATIAG